MNWKDEVNLLLKPIWKLVLACRGRSIAGYDIFGVTSTCGCDGQDIFIRSTNFHGEETFLRFHFNGCWHDFDNLYELTVGFGDPSTNVSWILRRTGGIRRVDPPIWNPSIYQFWDEEGVLYYVHILIDGGKALWQVNDFLKYVVEPSTTGVFKELPRSIRDLRYVRGEKILQKIELEVLLRDVLVRADIRGFRNSFLGLKP